MLSKYPGEYLLRAGEYLLRLVSKKVPISVGQKKQTKMKCGIDAAPRENAIPVFSGGSDICLGGRSRVEVLQVCI